MAQLVIQAKLVGYSNLTTIPNSFNASVTDNASLHALRFKIKQIVETFILVQLDKSVFGTAKPAVY